MIDKELIDDYRHFLDEVAQCYAYLLAGDEDSAHDLIALTSGQAMGFASRLGLAYTQHTEEPTIRINNEQMKPWVEIGISRATWYRDQRRSKANDAARGLVDLGPADISNKITNE